MKKALIFILAIAAMILVGCSGQTGSVSDSTVPSADTTKTSAPPALSKAVTDSASTAVESTSPSASASPQPSGTGLTGVDVYGEITEIVGNEVTLKLMEKPDPSTQGQGQGNNGVPRAKNYTGEVIDFIIPVGIPLFTKTKNPNNVPGSGTGTGPIETEIKLNDIQKGWTLQVFYQDDGKTIEKIFAQKPVNAS